MGWAERLINHGVQAYTPFNETAAGTSGGPAARIRFLEFNDFLLAV